MVRLNRVTEPSAWVGAILLIASAVACSDGPLGEPDPLRVDVETLEDPKGRGDSVVDFGNALVGKQVTRTVTIRNDEKEPVAVDVQGLTSPFGTTYPVTTLDVRAEGVLTFVFTFEPQAAGAAAAQVSVEARLGSRTKRIPILLVGAGVEPAFECEPGPLDFGRVLTRMKRSLAWRCENRTKLWTWVRLDDLWGESADRFEAHIVAKSGGFARTIEVAPGEEVGVQVTFDARAAGDAEASVALLESDGVRLGELDMRAIAVDEELIVEPDGCLDFGDVAFGASAERTLLVTNSLPFSDEIAIDVPGDDDGEFTVVPFGSIRLEDFESRHLTVRFEPRLPGEREVSVRLDRRWGGTIVEACARGVGHGPKLTCDDRIDFSELVAGFSSTRRIRCRNDGFFRGGEAERPLQVSAVRSTDPAFKASVIGGIRPGGYKVGEGFEIDVTYAPSSGGTHDGAIEIHGEGAPGGSAAVAVAGSAIELPPCSAAVEPSFLDFGIVSPGRVATAYVGVRNLLTSGSCRASMFLSSDSDPALVFGAGRAQTLEPGESMVLPVLFSAPASGTYARGRLIVEVSDPRDPIREVVIEGQAGVPCLGFEPEAIEFPSVPRACATPVRTVTIRSCPGATIESIELAAGLDADSFFISRPQLPATPADDEPTSFDVWFSPQSPETVRGAVMVHDGQGSHRLPLQGRASDIQTDTLVVDDPAAPLPLSVPPADMNNDGMSNERDIEVQVDGWLTHPVDELHAQVWSYDPDAQAIRFEPAFAPEPGATVMISYRSTCLSGPAGPD